MKKIMLTIMVLAFSSAAHAETIKVSVNGLVCAFCATGIEKTLKKQKEVEGVKVDLEAALVTIDTKKDVTLDDATVTKLITDAGYSVTGIERKK
jgi:copper chaperone CopZ